MKANIFVTLKKTVLDPQGQTIQRALNSLGHPEVATVRQGKYFEIELQDGISAEQAKEALEKIAADVLANPVIEEYRVDLH